MLIAPAFKEKLKLSLSLPTASNFQRELQLDQSSKNYVLLLELKLFESRIQHNKPQLNWKSVDNVISNIVSKG